MFTSVRFDDLTLEKKHAAATELKIRWLRGLYPGVDFYKTEEETA